MKGSITLDSTPNVGSKASFTIPLRVSSWCCGPNFGAITSSPPNPGFRLSSRPIKIPMFKEPFAHRTMNKDLLNQQISNSMTNYPPMQHSPPQFERSLRHGSINEISNLPLVLSAEERSKIHVLVVEDKYVPLIHFILFTFHRSRKLLTQNSAINQTIALKNIRKLGFPVTAVWNGREALSYLLSPSQPRPAIILMDVQMP